MSGGAASSDDEETLLIPDAIELDAPATCLAFHDALPHLACGCVDGTLLYLTASAGARDVSERLHVPVHRDSIRSLSFVSPTQLVTGSADRSIAAVDLQAGKVLSRRQAAHACPLTKLYSYQHMLASGDERGGIKVWDLRQRKAVLHFEAASDYISDLLLHPAENALLATSGDGSLGVFDLRRGARAGESVSEDADFLSLAIVMGGAQVCVGTGAGDMLFYGWGRWELYDVKFSGHPESVDAMVAVDENMVVTGSADGLLRLVSVHPNQFLGLLGEVPEEYAIEAMEANHDHTMLATSSHDSAVRFWDMSFVPSKKRQPETIDGEGGARVVDTAQLYVKKTPKDERKEFFADMKE